MTLRRSSSHIVSRHTVNQLSGGLKMRLRGLTIKYSRIKLSPLKLDATIACVSRDGLKPTWRSRLGSTGWHSGHRALLLCAALLLALTTQGADLVNIGPLFSEVSLTLKPGTRTEAAGPLYFRQESEGESQFGFPPFYSHVVNPDLETTEWDICYPILTYDRFGAEYRLQFMQLLSFSGGQTQQDLRKDRVNIMPFYMAQRSKVPEENYTAVVPFYGTLKNRLLRDEIHFVMFPLYAQSRKRDVVTDNYLYPIFHLRHGESLSGWQVLPLVGYEHKGVTTRTNLVDEVEINGGHKSFFALWPFFTSDTLGIGTTNQVRQQLFIPRYRFQSSDWLQAPDRAFFSDRQRDQSGE